MRLFLALFCLLFAPLMALEHYTVSLVGVDDPELKELIEDTAQLFVSKEKPPATLAALRRRAEADTARIAQSLQNYAYFSPTIIPDISGDLETPHVTITIEPGPIYTLESVEVTAANETGCCLNSIKPKHLGLCLDSPAYPEDIVAAEALILNYLERQGYPLGFIADRKIQADVASATIRLVFKVDTGPLCRFGPVSITGNCSVKDIFFRRKIWWTERCPYDPCLVARTIRDLESSGLFGTIAILHADQVDEDGFLPMEIVVEEGRQRSIAGGFSYATQLGFGVLGEWEHRNFFSAGERVSVKAHIRQRLKEAKFLYLQPDFCIPQQDLRWLAELQHERTEGFTESYFSFLVALERQWNDYERTSAGLMYKRLITTHSDHNGRYNLFKVPLQYRLAHIDNVLDPRKGYSLTLKTIPSFQMTGHRFLYDINTLTATYYRPLRRNRSIVFATRLLAGTILGASRWEIPSSERFYAGSENTLRGYKYLTVSPLDYKNKPIGGRSIAVLAAELRFRFSENWGGVVFYDIGNVYGKPMPDLTKKQLQAVGFGVRYHTPVGPLRLDFAFPTTPRKRVRDHLQIYMSIGQAF